MRRYLLTAILIFALIPIIIHIQQAYGKVFEVTIANPNYKPLNVGVWGFKTTKSLKKYEMILNKTITKDSQVSGFFVTDTSQSFSYNAPFRVVLGLSRLYHLDYTIYGDMYVSSGAVYVNLKILDVGRRRIIANQIISSNFESVKWIGNKIVDELIYYITGKYGPFESRIVFSAGGKYTRDLYVADFNGDEPVRITKWHTMNVLPKWINSHTIAFLSYQRHLPVIYTVDISTGKTRKLFSGANLSITPVRYKNYFAMPIEKYGDVNIYIVNKKGKILKSLTHSYSINVSPSFTSNYTKMVFVSNRVGGPQVFIKNIPLNETSRLTYEGNYNTSSIVSPDNKRIAYISLRNGISYLRTMNLDGSKQRTIVAGYGLDSPSWAYDSLFIVVEGMINGVKGIYVVNTLTGYYSLVIKGFKMYNGVSASPRLE